MQKCASANLQHLKKYEKQKFENKREGSTEKPRLDKAQTRQKTEKSSW